MPCAVFSFTNNTVDKEYNRSYPFTIDSYSKTIASYRSYWKTIASYSKTIVSYAPTAPTLEEVLKELLLGFGGLVRSPVGPGQDPGGDPGGETL